MKKFQKIQLQLLRHIVSRRIMLPLGQKPPKLFNRQDQEEPELGGRENPHFRLLTWSHVEMNQQQD
jgi:hypothetical protein